MRKTVQAFAVLAVVVVGGSLLHAEILEQVIVKVNGDIITKTDFEQRQVAALRARNIAVGKTENEALKKAISEVTPQLIVDAVDELLLVQRGHELEYKLSDQQFTSIVEQIRKENKLESDEAFQAALKQEGMTMDDLRRNLEKQMIISRVQSNEVMGKVGISEEEARKYHDEHLQEFTKPGSVTLREIFVALPADDKDVDAAADKETRDHVEALRKRVTSGGEAFEKVASEASTAPSRANGGLIGPLNEAELAPALQELLKKMKPGDVSDVIRTPKGYQLLQLESRTEPQVLTAEQARDQIADRLFDQKRRVELQKYLLKLRGQAIIDWKNEELHKVYDAEIAKQAAEEPAAAPAAVPTSAPPSKPTPPPTN
jgi:peptidyl-prolyl cis-trans isomerase SurA